VMLPDALRAALRRHLEAVRAVHQADLTAGFGRVVLPGALEPKFPQALRPAITCTNPLSSAP
jgi:hypothetical protein